MTFAEMRSAVAADLGYAPASTTENTRIDRYINEGYRHLMAQPGREQLRDATITLTVENNRIVYPLPQAVVKIYAITQVTNSTRLGMRTMDWYRSANPGLNQSTNFSYIWVPYGWAPVLRQPEGTGLWVASTSAADTTQRVNVAGFLTNGDTSSVQSSVLTGTTRLQIGTATTWNLLTRLDLSAVGAGVISVYDAAVAGNEIIRLQPGQTSAQYQHILFFPTPSGSIDYKVDVCLALIDLVNDNDIPLLPADFHDMLPLYARMRDYERQASVRLASAQAEWTKRGRDLADYVNFPKDYMPVMGAKSNGVGVNDLGAYYPADFYIWP